MTTREQLAEQRHERLERFANLGLTGNPFRVLEPHEFGAAFVPYGERSELSVKQLLNLTTPLTEFFAAEGVGKTTLLRVLQQHWEEAGRQVEYVYLPAGRREKLGETSAKILIIDEAQRLTWKERKRLVSWLADGRSRLVTGTHRFWRSSRLRATRYQLPPLSLARVHGFFVRRLTLAGDDGSFSLSDAAAHELLVEGQTLRRIERWLYEVFERWPTGPADGYVLETRELTGGR